MKMKLETVAFDDIKPVEKNVRLHPKKQIEEFKRSYEMFGQYRPFIVSHEGEILVGNGMYQALFELGVQQAEVKRLPAGTSEDMKRKLMLADNRIYMLGADNANNIDELITELEDFDIPGFDESVLEDLYADMDDVDFESFGVISDERKDEIKRVEVKYDKEPRGDITHTVAEASMAESDEQQCQNAAMTEAERHAGNYVTCPNCGMKIWR